MSTTSSSGPTATFSRVQPESALRCTESGETRLVEDNNALQISHTVPPIIDPVPRDDPDTSPPNPGPTD